MDTTKNTIAFKINVDTADSCGKLANFIYKRENHLDMDHEEIDFVRYKYYMKEAYSNRTSDKWIRTIYKDAEFTNVKEPENIKKITSVFDVVYCIVIGETMDIVDVSNVFLIKHFYSNLNILLLFEKCSDDSYYRTSQFLYSVNEKYPSFYDNCFFIMIGRYREPRRAIYSFPENLFHYKLLIVKI